MKGSCRSSSSTWPNSASPAESIVAGRTLREIDFRRRYGVTVVAIRRGERRLQLPDGHTMLFPYDRLTVVGTDEEFRIFHRVLDEQRSERKRRREEKTATALRIGSYTLPARSALDGTTLGEAEVRPPRPRRWCWASNAPKGR